jgi:FdhD protein
MNDPRYGNSIEVVPGPGTALDMDRLVRTRRAALTTSACGVCGRDGIDDLLARLTAVASDARVPHALLRDVPALLAGGQVNFARTGGVHAACAVSATGEVLAHAEDVGRHNAVDKVVGKLLYAQHARAPAEDDGRLVLAVSGRASFEIVQKAAVAGFVCVASVSAPSSLAIDTAERAGLTLAAFVRDGHYTLYTHTRRVQ